MDLRKGLFAVDKDDPNKSRTARPAAATFKRLTEANAVPKELAATYPID